jgi:hypothetical protein
LHHGTLNWATISELGATEHPVLRLVRGLEQHGACLMNILSTRAHGVIDCLTGALLILAPYLFGFATGGVEQWLPQILGLAILGMSLITRYELSLAKIVPLPVHLGVDFAGGLLLAVSPWLFGFADLIWWPHLLVGLMEIVVAAVTERRPQGVI